MITRKQDDPIALISQGKFNKKLLNEKEALKKMAIGLSQIKEGKGIPHKKAISQLKSLSKKWK